MRSSRPRSKSHAAQGVGRRLVASCAGPRFAPRRRFDRRDLGQKQLDLLPRRHDLRVDLGKVAFAMADSAQGRGDLVILHLPDRVELVIVAASAVDRQAEETSGRPCRSMSSSSSLLTTAFMARLCWFWPAVSIGAGDEEAGRLDGRRVIGPKHVAGKLQPGELVIRQVAIEGVDHPVAIAPGVGRNSSNSNPLLSP